MILKKIVCSALLFFSFAAYAAQETSALDLTRLERLIPTEEQLFKYFMEGFHRKIILHISARVELDKLDIDDQLELLFASLNYIIDIENEPKNDEKRGIVAKVLDINNIHRMLNNIRLALIAKGNNLRHRVDGRENDFEACLLSQGSGVLSSLVGYHDQEETRLGRELLPEETGSTFFIKYLEATCLQLQPASE